MNCQVGLISVVKSSYPEFNNNLKMILTFLLKGLILGFSVAAPVGPIGVLCINRTLNKGYLSGLLTRLGTATADLVYGLVAGLGILVVSVFLTGQKQWLQIVGLVFLVYLGVKTLLNKSGNAEVKKPENGGLLMDYLSTFFLTITNPLTIVFFLAVFSGLGLSNSGNEKAMALPLVVGVFAGSGAWWLFLSALTFGLKRKVNDRVQQWINIASGVIILVFASVLLKELSL